MSIIQINYDLKAPGRDYKSLNEYIRSYPYAHLLDSCWLVRTAKAPAGVRDELQHHMDANDQVAVFDVTNSGWAINFSNEATSWLKSGGK